MNLADLAIRRPIFITCLVIVMLAVGWSCLKSIPVDLFPDVNFPIVTVTTPYSGAGPAEIETLVTKPIEDELSTISGLKRLTSNNIEGTSQIVAEFRLQTDIKYAEQQVRDRIGAVRSRLPTDIKEPVIRRIDPSDQPIFTLALNADLSPAALYDVADDIVRPKVEQVNSVGLVDIKGGRKREIQVLLDRRRLLDREIPVTTVADKLAAAGENVPAGKLDEGAKETVFRTVGEFRSLDDIRHTIISLFGNEVPARIQELGEVRDSLEEEKTRSYVNGKKSLFLNVYRQSGANTVAVADAVEARIQKINEELALMPGKPQLSMVQNASRWIKDNVEDVKSSILIGILLTIFVVYFFLANFRSTLITGLALPNSLIGAFILMFVAGFTVNIVTLLALSLSVGLLIDDAIVVRENIFRHIEAGEPPREAALTGTAEVRLAVVATTLVVLAVFGPVAFIKGFTGQFFRQFGSTICFAMLISLFDALTMAPMLSAYLAGRSQAPTETPQWRRWIGAPVAAFDRLQAWLEASYGRLLAFTVRRPIVILGASLLVFLVSFAAVAKVPKTFFPPQDAGEFGLNLDLPPGTNLETMDATAQQADTIVRSNPEVAVAALTVGGRNGEANEASFYIRLVPFAKRKISTIEFKDRLREEMKPLAAANPIISDLGAVGEQVRQFTMNIQGSDAAELHRITQAALAILKKHPGLKDVDTNDRPGKPEFQVRLSSDKARLLGISSRKMGNELRAQVEGVTPVRFREAGREYDIRVRIRDDQRNLRDHFNEIYIPNINDHLVRLHDVATPVITEGPSTIHRQDRSRYLQISADIAANAGLSEVMKDVKKMLRRMYRSRRGCGTPTSETRKTFRNLVKAS